MITYHYRCECGHEFEVLQSIKDKPIKKCPSCKKNKTERVIHGGSDVFIDQGVTTIGRQAEENSRKMGKYKLSELAELNKKDEKEGFTFTTKEQRKKLAKKTPEQVKRYILDGK